MPDIPTPSELEPIVEATGFPVSLDLNTLNRCNASCVMCPFAVKYDDRHEPLPAYYRLTVEEYEALTAGMRVGAAHFVGAYAEPLMNKDIFRLVALARSRGAATAMTSNGTLLSRALAGKLVDAGLDLLTVSLHGATKATAEGIMRGADFDRVLENLRGLRDLKRERGVSHPTVQFNFVGQRANVEELPRFVELAASLEVRTIHLVHLLDGAAEVDQTASLVHHPELLVRYAAAAREVARRLGVALYVSPAYQAVIDARGGAAP